MKEQVIISKEEYEKLLNMQKKASDLESKANGLEVKIANMQMEIAQYKKIIFGSKSEQSRHIEGIDSMQVGFFDNVEEVKEILVEIKKTTKEITVNAHKRKINSLGIRASKAKDIEVEIEEYDIEEDKGCPDCGSKLKKVGKKYTNQRIEMIPAKIKLVKSYRTNYKCTCCGTGKNDKATDTFVLPNMPKPLIVRSIASASLVAQLIYDKFVMGTPFYRQESKWFDMGLSFPRSTMASWCITISQNYLDKLVQLMNKEMGVHNEVIHMDETSIQCNKEAGRKASSKSYMWVKASGQDEKIKGVIYTYSASRSSKITKGLTEGFSGILITDGYAGYNKLENITHAQCWAHARRYLLESIPTKETPHMSFAGEIGVSYCNELFKIEKNIAEFSPEKKQSYRIKNSAMVLKKMYDWVEDISKKPIVNEKLQKAITYLINQRKELSEFLNDGRIPLDNNLVERAIRPFAVHRKNWLFADTEGGAHTNATIYSLVESAKLNNLDVHKYMEHILRMIPNIDMDDNAELEKLLPWSNQLPKEISVANDNIEKISKELLV